MKILIIDDDPALLRSLSSSLAREGYDVCVASQGHQGLRMAYEEKPDLVLLDVLMPEINGWETCQRLRELSSVPVIFLTARGDEPDVVRGLNYGADDYLAKPFSLAELLARVEAVIRRANSHYLQGSDAVYQDDTLTIDLSRHTVHKRGEALALTPKEFNLLACLVRHAEVVVQHSDLLREVWGEGYEGEQSYLALYVHYLRQKLEDDPTNPQYIHTRSRVGYCFSPKAKARDAAQEGAQSPNPTSRSSR